MLRSQTCTPTLVKDFLIYTQHSQQENYKSFNNFQLAAEGDLQPKIRLIIKHTIPILHLSFNWQSRSYLEWMQP